MASHELVAGRYRVEEELGRAPTDDEVARVMGMPVNKVAHLKSVSVRPTRSYAAA